MKSNSGMPTNSKIGKDGQRTGRGARQLRGNMKFAKIPAEVTKPKEAAPGWFILEYQHGLRSRKKEEKEKEEEEKEEERKKKEKRNLSKKRKRHTNNNT